MRIRDEKPNAFPEELRKGIGALADRTRERILFILTIRDSSYTELQRTLKIRKGSLTHHLKGLMKAGLVRNYSKERLSGPFDSFYTITDFGRDLLEAIVTSFQPIEPQTKLDWRILWTFTASAVSFPDLGGKIPISEPQTIQVR
jgi:DNA-binding HxlR family transcriptional regulator